MQHIVPPLIILVLAAITPGPNNVIVMRIAAIGDFRPAIAAIAVIALSGSAMTLASGFFLSFLSDSAVIFGMIVGTILLAIMAAQGWIAAGQPIKASIPPKLTLLFVALFQLVNPKAWILVGTVAASASVQGLAPSITALGVLFVTAICLSLWAGFGTLAQRFLQNQRRRLIFDRVMAGMLFAFALSLPFQIS